MALYRQIAGVQVAQDYIPADGYYPGLNMGIPVSKDGYMPPYPADNVVQDVSPPYPADDPVPVDLYATPQYLGQFVAP